MESYAAESVFGKFTPTPRIVGIPTDICIGNDVWIGENVVFAKNVNIGNGAVVAGHSVVVKDVPPYTIVGGNPAKFIKMRFDSADLIEELLKVQWWKYNFNDFSGLNFEDPASFIKGLISRIENSSILEFQPTVITKAELAH